MKIEEDWPGMPVRASTPGSARSNCVNVGSPRVRIWFSSMIETDRPVWPGDRGVRVAVMVIAGIMKPGISLRGLSGFF